MHSPSPGQPIPRGLPLPNNNNPSARGDSSRTAVSQSRASAVVSGGGATASAASPSLSSAHAIASFSPFSLMRRVGGGGSNGGDLKAICSTALEKIRAEETARDESLRRAHLLMLSLGRDYTAANSKNHQHRPSSALGANDDDYDVNASSPTRRQNTSLMLTTVEEVFDPFVEDLNEADGVYHRSLDQAQQIAQRIEGSTHIAEASSTQVKRLDVLLSRVKTTLALTNAMLAKRQHLQAMDAAMRAEDLEKASAAVEGYEAAKRVVLETRIKRLSKPSSSSSVTAAGGKRDKDWGTVGPNDDLNEFSDETDEDDGERVAEDDASSHHHHHHYNTSSGGIDYEGHNNRSSGNNALPLSEGAAAVNGSLVNTSLEAGGAAKGTTMIATTSSNNSNNTQHVGGKYKLSRREERELVAKVKEALLKRIRDQMRAAMAEGKRDEVVRFVQLLSRVSSASSSSSPKASNSNVAAKKGSAAFSSRQQQEGGAGGANEACVAYVQWVCDNALAELTARVDGELKTIKGAKNTEQSHLASASAALDHVVATLEHEEGFVADAFGRQGLTTLLETLHKRCTTDVVRIIRDYLVSRKVGVATASSDNGGGASGQQQQRLSDHVSINKAKKLDQTLEEIAHLVCCCHMYMSYIDERYHEAQQSSAAGAGEGGSNSTKKQPDGSSKSSPKDVARAVPAAFDRSHYSVFVTKDNPLFEAIQELLAVYIPMQREYFETASTQSIAIDKEMLSEFAAAQAKERLKQIGAGQDQQQTQSSGGLFGTINNFVGNNNASHGNAINVKEVLDDAAFVLKSAPPDVVLVEDLFYVLRIAVHRAFSTRSNVIASSVLVAVTDTVTDTIAKEVLRHIRASVSDEGAYLRGTTQTLSGIFSQAVAASAGTATASSFSAGKHLMGPPLLKGGDTPNSSSSAPTLQQLFNDLSSGRNLYSTTVWLTHDLLAKEESHNNKNNSKSQHRTTSHFLDVDPMTMLPTGRSSSNVGGMGHHRLSSPLAGTAAESSETLHAARLFQWVAAAFSMCQYVRKLSKDIDPLAAEYFGESKTDIVRFREQRQEMEAVAFLLEENVKLALCELSQAIAETNFVSKKSMRGFLEQRYDLSEEEFNRLDHLASIMSPLSGNVGLLTNPRPPATATGSGAAAFEPWVPALTQAWGAATRRLRAQLSQREEIFELLMSNIIEWVAIKFEHCILPEGVPTPAADGSGKVIMTYPHANKPMVINDYGALQLDKEMRQLRGYFLNAVEGNVPVRERFARLSAITSLLLVDRIQDVADVASSVTVLTPEEKKRVLLLKTNLPPSEVRALTL